jgi:hypothetical protein
MRKVHLYSGDWSAHVLVVIGDAGMGDRCRCGGFVELGLGSRWRLKGSGRVWGQTPRLSGDEAR